MNVGDTMKRKPCTALTMRPLSSSLNELSETPFTNQLKVTALPDTTQLVKCTLTERILLRMALLTTMKNEFGDTRTLQLMTAVSHFFGLHVNHAQQPVWPVRWPLEKSGTCLL